MGEERRVGRQRVLLGVLVAVAAVSSLITLSVVLAFFFALVFAIHGGTGFLRWAMLMWPALPIAAVSDMALLILIVTKAVRGSRPASSTTGEPLVETLAGGAAADAGSDRVREGPEALGGKLDDGT